MVDEKQTEAVLEVGPKASDISMFSTVVFVNPSNNYQESVSFWGPFIWSFLFGSIYMAIKGIWGHAIFSLFLALITFGISWFIYPFFVPMILRKRYLQKGWKIGISKT